MPNVKSPITDAVDILYRRYIKDDPEMVAMMEEEESNLELARLIYDMREEAGLTHRQMAEKSGIDVRDIIRLEDCDYEGNVLVKLRRIAKALNKTVHIRVEDEQ